MKFPNIYNGIIKHNCRCQYSCFVLFITSICNRTLIIGS